jgi:hypothetical protein
MHTLNVSIPSAPLTTTNPHAGAALAGRFQQQPMISIGNVATKAQMSASSAGTVANDECVAVSAGQPSAIPLLQQVCCGHGHLQGLLQISRALIELPLRHCRIYHPVAVLTSAACAASLSAG